ncbi:16S rRNA (uracil(1498)-N(3))-methyltransferase [Thiohalobacter sp. IOR34]|uniref:16S rRNA (uracil(1498)-N(3))-methyltransferase n=1 Tax=Thiohalobacter sp. IOR34 TaxID=3057176 RepID=UPI0025B0514E|nr:16S rRNA (uracil(1498)-N(3))-methyltransferase [Thiohalobacter sp. IOR34]WJW75799.1 16S rRNA (uracil(1498)-N(3))-methyltransferase [Thiohalobacter sp. IOR34]
MRIPRIYQPGPLAQGRRIELDERARRHVATVLRLKPGAEIRLFNGQGGEWQARLDAVSRRAVLAEIGEWHDEERESPLAITLLQGVSRGERMDLTIQKAVELGVQRIVPIACARTTVRLDAERRRKRWQHWQGVILHACEQCGRNRIPELSEVVDLATALERRDRAARGLLLDPLAEGGLAQLGKAESAFCLLIGPEGGLEEGERQAARQAGFTGLRLGPRVLRTETAALTAIAVLQQRYGDLG